MNCVIKVVSQRWQLEIYNLFILYNFKITIFRIKMFVFISHHITLFNFREHFVLVFAYQVNVDINHLVVFRIDVYGVKC